MTKEQILAEIAAKIDGQGSAIDAGSALPGILRGILDLIPAEQVNSDWNATEGPAKILNKPTIPEGALIVQGQLGGGGAYIIVPNTEVLRNAAKAGRVSYIQLEENVFCLVVYVGPGGTSKAVTADGKILSVAQ